MVYRQLFLTNHQAELLAQPDNVAKLFNALDIRVPPKLLIVLQWDGHFRRQMATAATSNRVVSTHERKNGAFVNGEASQDAEAGLDRFMAEVLIPLAVQTNAIVICDAVSQFELSASFMRMVAVQRASFADGMPFTIIAMTDEIHCLYSNFKQDCHWRAVRRRSRAWAKRDAKLTELLINQGVYKIMHRYDLSTADDPLLVPLDCRSAC